MLRNQEKQGLCTNQEKELYFGTSKLDVRLNIPRKNAGLLLIRILTKVFFGGEGGRIAICFEVEAQVGLELRDRPAFASLVLGSEA